MDLGLPSETLWLDRLVGASSPSSNGLYYQWGAINGHTATEGFSFDADTYHEQGLDSISSNLSEEQDAARAYYGNNAKMPTDEQINELLQYCSPSAGSDGKVILTSSINGNTINLKLGGYIDGSEVKSSDALRIWTNVYRSAELAYAIHGSIRALNKNLDSRALGLNIMAVHS